MKCLLVHGWMVSGRIANARMQTLHGAGHYPQVERPDALASLVRASLADGST